MSDFHTLEEFAEHVSAHIVNYLPDSYRDAEISLQKVVKNNDLTLTGLMIKTPDQNIAPNIYLNDLYQRYLTGEEDISSIMRTVAQIRVDHEQNVNFDVTRITDFEQVKDKIEPRLINFERNSEYLQNKPCTQIEDLAVIYAINLGENESGKMSVPITNELMNQWSISSDELHQIALENLSRTDLSFKSMHSLMMEMMGASPDDPEMMAMFPDVQEPQMYVLTNASKINGAAGILDQNTMKDISLRFGGDFYILPSSVHEVIMIPMSDQFDRQTLESMVQDVNAGQVAPEEQLSDHVYAWDSERERIVLADKLQEQLKENDLAVGQDMAAEENQMNMRRHRGR